MNRQQMILSVIKLLCDSGKPLTTDKIATTLEIDQERASILLEDLSDRGVVNRKVSEEFEDSFYTANKTTKEFLESLKPELEALEASRQKEAKPKGTPAAAPEKYTGGATSAEQAKEPEPPKALSPGKSSNAAKSPDADPLVEYLKDSGAPEHLLQHYQKILAERDKSKREIKVWKTSFRELTNSLKKGLGQL